MTHTFRLAGVNKSLKARLKYSIGASKFLLLILLSCKPGFAKDKDWHDGKLLSCDQKTFTTYSQTNGSGRETPHTTYSVQIDTPDRIYFAERTLNFAWQKFPKVTENGPIVWALKGDHEMVLRDDKGKEFTLTVIKTKIK